MPAPRNSRDLFAKIASSTPPTTNVVPEFPRLPPEIIAANPRIAEAWLQWEKAVAEWVKRVQVGGVLPT